MLRALLILLVLAGPAWARPERDPLRARLLAALEHEDPGVRAGAFDALAGRSDLGALRAALAGVKALRDAHGKAWARMPRVVARFERARTSDMDAQSRVETARRRRASSGRIRQLEGAKARAAAHRRRVARELEAVRSDARVARGLLGGAARAVGDLLARLGDVERRAGLLLLREAWSHDKDPEAWLLWVDALAASATPGAADELARAASGRAPVVGRLRALALDGLVRLDAARAVRRALPLLERADIERQWHVLAAAIDVLRRARRKAGIPALIAFLGRPGIARLREDAHQALRALTHRTHGPYRAPWQRWWREAGEGFEVPPQEPPRAAGGDASSTAFYGIHTFSDRMAFVIDLSWSMWRSAGSERRVDTALTQLRGAVGTLDAERRFVVVWFGTRADTWRPRMQAGTERVKRDLERWTEGVEGRGQTNAFEGLERAFRIARSGSGRPPLDTVFFLTDGAPTAGPLSRPADILAEVRAWSRVERVRVHCIGVGEHEPALLEPLARLGGGRYVRK